MDSTNSQIFEMRRDALYFDTSKSIILCKSLKDNKNRWVKKTHDVYSITSILEDSAKFYIAGETDEESGQFLALDKKDGSTLWYIPGRAFFQQLFDEYLYIIFADEKKAFYLIKAAKPDGSKIWHHEVREDLVKYSFRKDRILLTYSSNDEEIISPVTGKDISNYAKL
ncbi:MAG: hypothetical protein GY754_11700 [bacterium]|nr:hypothetical protein [bacterium]